MASFVTELASPKYVVAFQKWCGVEFVNEDEDEDKNGSNRFPTSKQSTDSANNVNGLRSRLQEKNGFNKSNNNNVDNGESTSPLYSKNGISCMTNNNTKNGLNQHLHHRVNGLIGDSEDRSVKNCQGNENGVVQNGVSKHLEPGKRPTPSEGKSATRVVIRYPVLHYWARLGAFLGNEEFYLTGLPLVIWAVDSAVLRQTVLVWWLVMYLGQAAKDYFAWPRPPSPPVVRLETQHLAEYSMPSTHAMAGTAIPLLLSKLLLERYQLPTVLVMSVALFWCLTTCLSRLYLGVHTVLDLLSGFLVSLIIYLLVSPLTSGYDRYQQTHPLAPLVLVLTSLALCTICYPSSGSGDKAFSAKHDAITITSVSAGLGVGAWLNYQLGLSQLVPKRVRVPVSLPTLPWFGASLLQLAVGVLVVFAVKKVLKKLTTSFFTFVFFGLEDHGKGQGQEGQQQHPGVSVGVPYVTYLVLGVVITFLNPLIFTVLGFGRPSYYLEML